MAKFTCNFISYTLQRTVDITVVVPTPTFPEASCWCRRNESSESGHKKFPIHTSEHKYPVIYLLHGYGNNHATWTDYTNAELYAEERNIALVMMGTENKAYINMNERDLFFDFLNEELPDFVCGMFPISRREEDTYLAGLSMGGYGTLVHGFTFPQRYRALGIFSSAIYVNPTDMDNGGKSGNPAYDISKLASDALEKRVKLPDVYAVCGDKDMLFEDNKKFVAYLRDHGVDVTWVPVADKGHEWRLWDEAVEKFMDYLPRTDYYAQKGKRQI